MRLTVARLRRVIKRDLAIEFGREQLTSYGGLELLRRFFGHIGLNARIRCALAEQRLGGDYGASHLILLVVGLLVVGARRLAHLRYVTNDPLFARLCGLTRLPSDRTVVNWLKQFTQTSLRALVRLNSELLYEQIEQLKLPRLTIDLDGTVICTGAKVASGARCRLNCAWTRPFSNKSCSSCSPGKTAAMRSRSPSLSGPGSKPWSPSSRAGPPSRPILIASRPSWLWRSGDWSCGWWSTASAYIIRAPRTTNSTSSPPTTVTSNI